MIAPRRRGEESPNTYRGNAVKRIAANGGREQIGFFFLKANWRKKDRVQAQGKCNRKHTA